MKRQRQPLDVSIEGAPQVVGHPLAYTGGEILFGIGRNRIKNGDGKHGDTGELDRGKLIGPQKTVNQAGEVKFSSVGTKNFVQHNLERPRLQKIAYGLSQHGQQPKTK